jgi:acetyltransferase-like isoleucine patch superfamily enzyme
MLKRIYFTFFGYPISLILNLFGRIFSPFMVYGYWNSSTKSFKKNTRYSSTTVFIDKGKIDIADHCWIWHHSIIDGSNGVVIKEGVQIGAWVGIFTHSSHISIRLHGSDYIKIKRENRLGYVSAGVEIGSYSFIGAGSYILPGVKIGKGCVISAGSVVNKDIPDFSIAFGNPAKVIGSTLDMDKEYFEHPSVRESYFSYDVIEKYTKQL